MIVDEREEKLLRSVTLQNAQANLVSANALVGVAKAAYFPRITLTGFLGYESAQLTKLFNNSRSTWAFVPEVTQPIFTAGRIKSGVRFSEAQREEFLVNYEKAIQNAFREVSDSLIAYRKVKEVRAQREDRSPIRSGTTRRPPASRRFCS